tara:strand:- start:100 stop:303 length:204 start_codon:yes stop_codon:yes gene_type:complete
LNLCGIKYIRTGDKDLWYQTIHDPRNNVLLGASVQKLKPDHRDARCDKNLKNETSPSCRPFSDFIVR